jgi:large subunit ribosomal protein L25
MGAFEIVAETRAATTKAELNRRRRAGYIPAITYGGGRGNQMLWVRHRSIVDAVKQGSLEGTLLTLRVNDDSFPTIIKEIQRDAVSQVPIHIDFQVVSLTERVEVKVPVQLSGEAEALKATGGLLDFVHRELHIRVFPKDIPHSINLDISKLRIGDAIHVKDIPQTVFSILEDPESIVVHIIPKRVEEAVPAAGAETATATEPEVVGKGKKTEEGAEGAAADGAPTAKGKPESKEKK